MKHTHLIKRKSQYGFTILEIIIVLGIIVGLMAMVTSQITGRSEQANVKITITQIGQLQGAIMSYRQDNKKFPARLADLVTEPDNARHWLGPYIKDSQLQDPWGNDFIYRNPGQHGRYDILSYGADGKQGGTGVDADIGNWD